jgi:NitT/TauT family transport system ATP-binding protein
LAVDKEELAMMYALNQAAADAAKPAANAGQGEGLRVERLHFAYRGDTSALDDINITVAEGEFLCLLGESGCGKTTLLRLLAGLRQPLSGTITWRGRPVTGPSIERGIVFQEYSLFPWFRLKENIALAVRKAFPGYSRARARNMAEAYLAMTGLADAAEKYPHELSGGMRQRGAIARTLALGSSVLLMDEPFGALDPANRLRLQELLLEIWNNSSPRRTVVFVTHDVDEALFLADRVIVLGSSPGRVIGEMRVPFERPRVSEQLFDSGLFRELRARISAFYRRDARRQIDAPYIFASRGEGI